MRIVLLLACVLCICSIPAIAQHEADNWYFGNHSGISFRKGTPVIDSLGQHNTREGCAVISDKKTGALLFYSDGETIWNRNHEVMNNGTKLKGGGSSTQSVLIVPDPGNSLQYYVFTTSENESIESALYFSIVSLEDPDGLVVSKNNFLINNIAEKLTGTIDCPGTGYWVITHHRYDNTFYSFQITKSGVSTIPVISTYTSEMKGFIGGYMKLSPDNTKLALAAIIYYYNSKIKESSYVALYDFDASTGIISNYTKLSQVQYTFYFYGVSFSPDNSKLYATVREGTVGYIYQYEVYPQKPKTVASTGIPLYTNGGVGALQIAPNGKIYYTHERTGTLGVINNPNAKGTACNYTPYGLKISGETMLGLPNFMDYIFNSKSIAYGPLSGCAAPIAATKPDSNCVGNTLKFSDLSIFKTKRREWLFENGIPNTSTDSSVTVTYRQVGTFNVRLIVSNDKGSDTTYTQAIVFPPPTVKAGVDKIICPNATTQIGSEPEAGNTYSWLPKADLDDPSIANPNASPKTTTQYILTVTSEHGCIAYDTVLVTVGNIVAKVSNDTTICSGTSVQLLASGGAKYTWSPSTDLSDTTIENPIATPTKTTTYKVNVSSGTCEDSAFVTITVNPQPTANAGQDITLCIGASTEIGEASQAGFTYQWQPSNGLDDATKSNPTASPTSTTQYILTVTGNGGCMASDTVLVTIGTIKAIVSNDTNICEGSSVKLFASGGAKYEWSPSTGLDNSSIATPAANPTITTRYKVLVSNGTCIDSAFVTINILPQPTANAGRNKSICTGDSIQIGTPADPGNTYSWSPVIGLLSPFASQTTASPATTTTYTLTVSNAAGCVKSDEVIVTVNSRNERSFTLQPDMVTILPGKQFTTNLEIPSGVNDWSVTLKYDSLLVKFNSLTGAQAIPDDKTGELLVHGNGGSRSIPITFDTYLPHTSDTIYPIQLAVDSSKIAECEIWNAIGNSLMLADYCGKSIRVVSSTGKKYFLTVKDKSIDFGVGLSGNVRLEVFDYVGNSVLVVSDGALEAGEYSAGLDLPVGVYYCRMSAGMYVSVGKVLIAR